MHKMQEIMSFLWLLNAHVNSLLEPRMLAGEAISKASEFKEKLSSIDLNEVEKNQLSGELKNSLSYISETTQKLNELEESIKTLIV
ncbi:MAG: hypothetical protein GX892_10220 [Thermoanaerobacteraceae bacterium]|jgi:hypothetical protein|nr:hypothetical protein [Thermoanaerobacteraceae bacterium]